MGDKRRSRCTLALHKLVEFAAHCESKGWKRVPVKGDYEVLRMTKKGSEPLIVHATLNAAYRHNNGDCGHGTTWGMSARLVQSWLDARKHAESLTTQYPENGDQ